MFGYFRSWLSRSVLGINNTSNKSHKTPKRLFYTLNLFITISKSAYVSSRFREEASVTVLTRPKPKCKNGDDKIALPPVLTQQIGITVQVI